MALKRKPTSVAVIISTYNHPEWLEKTLWGYNYQSYQDFEIIVADDGSTQATAEMLERIKENTGLRIKHVWHPDDGFQKNRILNKAILESEAEYLIFTDQDCIPRFDFVKTHVRGSTKGRFLSGGVVRLPLEISKKLTFSDIEKQNPFHIKWLLKQGVKPQFKWTKLVPMRCFSWLMNGITPTKATWNGGNASGWRSDLLLVNGYNEDLHYGAEDRELGERLRNLNIRGRQLRFSAILLHLDHERPYKDAELVARNKSFLKYIRKTGQTVTSNGIIKKEKPN